jgi:cytochrome b
VRSQADTGMVETVSCPVWDLPTRVSHGLITVLFIVQFASGHFGLLPGPVHLWCGYLLLSVVLFRIWWGFAGSDSARFSHFVAGPRAVLEYLPRLFSTRPTHWPGHNPIGAISVMLLLGLLLIQCVTGLFHESWAELRGPLAERVGRSTAILLSDLHGLLRWPLLLVVVIHVTATLFYRFAKSENRISAIYGSGRLTLPSPPDLRQVPAHRAVIPALVCLLLVAMVIWLGPIE